jgi:lysophospholipase L1-like esterase
MTTPAVQQRTVRNELRPAPPSVPKVLAAILVPLGFAVLMFVLALVQAFAWNLLIYVVLACVFGSMSALSLHDVLARRLEAWPRSRVGLAASLLTLAGAVLLLVSILQEWVVVAAVDTVVVVLGLIGIVLAMRPPVVGGDPAPPPETPGSGPHARSRWGWFALGALGMVAAGVVMGAVDWSTVSWVALVVWLLSLTLLKESVGPLVGRGGERAGRGALVSGVVGVIGAVVLVLGASASSQFVLVVGVTLAIGGLSVFGICGSRLRLGPRAAWGVLAVGLLGVVGALVRTSAVVQQWHLAVALVLLVGIVGAWFVFRGEGFIVVVLICGVVSWAVVDRNGVDMPPAAADGAPRIVGVGDSFISGEGAENFIVGTNTLGDERNECRRASTAYTFLLANTFDATGVLLACSGAETRDVLEFGQMEHSPASVPGARPQIEELRDLDLGQGDVVLVSIGGNDVGFSDIVKACLLPAPCDERADLWTRKVRELQPILVDTYSKLRQAAGGAVVIVVPYPNYVPTEECGLGLSQPEHDFVQEFLATMDATIVSAARRAGVEVFEGFDAVFDGHRLCSAKPAANHLQLRPPDGPNFTRFSPGKWAHGPMHPNERGHRMLAAGLDDMVAAALEPGAANPPAITPAGQGKPSANALENAAEAVDEIADDEWIVSRLYEAAKRLMIPLSVAMVMAIVAATGFVHQKHWLARFIGP